MLDDRTRVVDPDAQRRGREAIITVLRVLILLLMAAVTLLAVLRSATESGGATQLVAYWPWAIAFTVALYVLIVVVDHFTPVKRISTIGGVFLGLLAGMLGAVAISFVIDLLAETYEVADDPLVVTVKILIGIALCYLGVTVVLQTQDDFRLLIPYVEFAKQMRGVRPLLLDSSALIDGRIYDIAETGLVQAPILVPRFVIQELQTLSDSSDRLKRARGRRGLDYISRLQRSARADVSVEDWPIAGQGVDTLLVEVAKTMNAAIVTTDTGLSRVAQIHSVPVLNINDLANALKTTVIPGEALTLEIVKPGEQPGQGVGYLEDGAMVVVEDGGDHVGDIVAVMVTSSMQTSAGRLIFGRIGADERSGDPRGESASPKDSSPAKPVEADVAPETGTGGERKAAQPMRTEARPTRRNPRR
jgi:uncharacterized protein YacL